MVLENNTAYDNRFHLQLQTKHETTYIYNTINFLSCVIK